MILRLANYLLRRPERHAVACTCPYHTGYAHGFYKAAALAQMSDEEQAFRRFLAAYEAPVVGR